jgi:hypothetical protein
MRAGHRRISVPLKPTFLMNANTERVTSAQPLPMVSQSLAVGN